MSINAAELGTSHDCKIPNCPNEAAVTRGRYAMLCDEHRAEQVRREPRSVPEPPPAGGSYVERLKGLTQLAREADAARLRALTQTQRALALKREAEAAERKFKAALRELAGEVEA